MGEFIVNTLQDIERIRQFFKPIVSLQQRGPRAMKVSGEALATLYFSGDSMCEGSWEIYFVIREGKFLEIKATQIKKDDASVEESITAFASGLGYVYDPDEYGAVFQRYVDSGLFSVTATKYLI